QNEVQNDLYRRLMAGELATPETWETQLSARGNTAEVWNELIDNHRLGYMALLRNLRNIVNSGSDRIPQVAATIADPEQVRRSKQLPFR
ncbi:TROVE domain-containing protein, partial [Klebsiella pneumoniae]|uniref:TROVE domain-containing protein n=1 Tax=Klebsiella pneumoniae TaxID=573 RepID=UPI0025A1E1E5